MHSEKLGWLSDAEVRNKRLRPHERQKMRGEKRRRPWHGRARPRWTKAERNPNRWVLSAAEPVAGAW